MTEAAKQRESSPPPARLGEEPRRLRIARLIFTAIWSVCATLGYAVMSGVITRSVTPENALLFSKMALSLGGIPVVTAIGLALLAAGRLSLRRAKTLRQRANDEIAKAIMEKLRVDPEAEYPPFFVYLRAFETTGKLRPPFSFRVREILSGQGALVSPDVESYLANALRGHSPVVALGQPGEADGAGRIVSEEETWTDDIVLLLRRSSGIVVVPSSRKGTVWELEEVRNEGLLTKCVFAMPPRTRHALDTRQRWEAAVEAIRPVGIELPSYYQRGMLFSVDSDGRMARVEPLLLSSKRKLRKSIRWLLGPGVAHYDLFAAISKVDRKTRRSLWVVRAGAFQACLPFLLGGVALLSDSPAPASLAHESWGQVLDRGASYKKMSDYELVERILLYRSRAYRKWEKETPEADRAAEKDRLTLKGIARVEDQKLRRFFVAMATMLERVDAKTCAAVASGKIDGDRRTEARSYMPSIDIDYFLRARTDAFLAVLEDRPSRPLTTDQMQDVDRRFLSTLNAAEREKWVRLSNRAESMTDDERCWFTSKLFGSVARLEQPYSILCARAIAQAWAGE